MPKNQRPQAPSYSEDLTDIIERYSSPASNSSPALNHQPYESTPQRGVGNDSLMSFPSSLPPYTSMSTPPLPTSRHRRTSTNSGYLSRAELFGRSSPVLSNEIQATSASSALERIEARRQQGRAAPEDSSVSTLHAQIPQQYERVIRERLSMRSLRSSNDPSSALLIAETPLLRRGSNLSLRGASANDRSGALSTPDLRSSRLRRRSSAMSMRSGYADTPRDEWMEAGTPVHELEGSGYGPGPTVSDNPALSFHRNDGRSSVSGAGFISSKTSSIRSDHETSKVSPAQAALRHTLGRSASPATPPVRKSSWTRRLFGRTERVVAPRPTPPSPISDDNVSEFEYIEPRSPTESPETILERIRARGANPRAGSNVVATETSLDADALDDSYFGEHNSTVTIAGSRPDGSIGQIGLQRRTAPSPAASLGPIEQLTADEQEHSAEDQTSVLNPNFFGETVEPTGEASSRAASLESSEKLCALEDDDSLLQRSLVPTSPHADRDSFIPSDSFVPASHISGADKDDDNKSQVSTPSPQRQVTAVVATPMSSSLSTSEVDTDRAAQPTAGTQETENSRVAIVLVEPPVSSRDALALSSPVIVPEQQAQDPQQELRLSRVEKIVSQSPTAPETSRGLSFATANAILYACTTLAALQHILLRIGDEVRSIHLVGDMAIAVVIGIVVCVMTHYVLNGRVEQARRPLMYVIGASVGIVRRTWEKGL